MSEAGGAVSFQSELGTRRFAASEHQAELLRPPEWQSPFRSSRRLPAAGAARALLRTARESDRGVPRSPDERPHWLSSSRDTPRELSFRRRELRYRSPRRRSSG